MVNLDPLRDMQLASFTYCDRCGDEVYAERNPDDFGAILCEKCREELESE